MMRSLLVCLLVFSLFQAQGQTGKNFHSIKPSVQVSKELQKGKDFQKVDLFSRSTKMNQKSDADSVSYFENLNLEKTSRKFILDSKPEMLTFSVPVSDGKMVELELYQIKVTTEDFQVVTSSGKVFKEDDLKTPVFYRGAIKGHPNSIASFTVQEGNLSGMFSAPDLGNMSIEKLPGQTENYALHHEKDGTRLEEFYCQVDDVGENYHISEIIDAPASAEVKCTRIYFEVDNDIYKDKGGVQQVTDYIKSIFNEVATIYANEEIKVEISEIFIWDVSSPYAGGSSLEMLNKFQQFRTKFNGDLGQLLSYKSSGGIAVVSGLCHPVTAAKMSFASISSSFKKFPNYSFTVLVIAHELGHLFGSMHTHACVWNGNNTAIDGCAGFVEGSCPNDKGIPSEGGTIMSYCHLTRAGTNLSLGFGAQPGNLIRNRIANASCLQVCQTDDGGDEEEEEDPTNPDPDPNPDPVATTEITFNLGLDYYPMEVVWYIKDDKGKEWYSGGPYEKEKAGNLIVQTFNLPAGNYQHVMEDFHGDGLCCKYGEGYYVLRNKEGNMIGSGSQYGDKRITSFKIGEEEKPPVNDGACLTVNFEKYPFSSYGGVQDQGDYLIVHSGNTLIVKNSAWKSMALDYTITENTVLEFDFASTREGDIHAIGFDKDEVPSGTESFQIFGRQDWGIAEYNNYEGNSVWKKYKIPVGKFYTGKMNRLFFICDDDFGNPKADSYYKNMKIYEGSQCKQNLEEGAILEELPDNAASNRLSEIKEGLTIVPNPAKDLIHLKFNAEQAGNGELVLYNLLRQPVLRRSLSVDSGFNRINLELPYLATGTYVAVFQMSNESFVEKIEIVP